MNDPKEHKNLAGDAEFAKVVDEMKTLLREPQKQASEPLDRVERILSYDKRLIR
jgi:hypothetical protein